jgi:hypothetical protein
MAWAQPVQNVNVAPACQMFFSFAAIGTTASYDNRTNGCDFWVISYSSFTFAGPLSMGVQRAANAAGSVPGAFANYAGAEVVAGINPNTSIVGAETQISGYNPWVRVNLSATGAGAGLVVGTIYGWRTGPPSMVSFLGTPSFNLAQYGGVAVGAGNALHVRPGTGALFNLGTVNAGADGVANVNAVTPALGTGGLTAWANVFNGTSWDRMRGSVAGALGAGLGSGVTGGVIASKVVCDLYAPVTLAAAIGYTQVVALAAGQQIRVCNISVAFAGNETPSLAYGTGANCAVGTTAITGAYSNVLALALDFADPLRVLAANALCVRQTVGAGGGGLVNYAIY